MYKAIDKGGTEFLICSAVWQERERLDELREFGRQDHLLCQECRTPVQVRAGDERRWHFAHKSLTDCPLASETPEVLKARALLYKWLDAKFTPKGGFVTIEKKLGPDYPGKRPVDGWVEFKGKKLAYSLIATRISQSSAYILNDFFRYKQVLPVWIFLSSLLQQAEDTDNRLNLCTAERELMHQARYGLPKHAAIVSRKSLHYLDPNTSLLTTYRNLEVIHKPGLHFGTRISTPLSDVRVYPGTGEFVHPGEEKDLAPVVKQPWTNSTSKPPDAHPHQPATAPPHSEKYSWRFQSGMADDMRNSQKTERLSSEQIAERLNPVCKCLHCGQETSDHWYHDGAGHCKCNKCLRKGLG